MNSVLRRSRHLFFVVCQLALSVALTSCGLIDMDMDTEAQPVLSMKLDRDTVYVMTGDRFVLTPVFTPDTISNQAVFFSSDDSDVAQVDDGTIVAVGAGWTTVTAVSASGRFVDRCEVCVIPRWEVSPYAYPDEMFVYAKVTVHGNEPGEDMMVAAMINDEARGVGQWLSVGKYRCMVFRVLNYRIGDGEDPDIVSFACYNRKTLKLEFFSQRIAYDGETHGSPAAPFELRIEN